MRAHRWSLFNLWPMACGQAGSNSRLGLGLDLGLASKLDKELWPSRPISELGDADMLRRCDRIHLIRDVIRISNASGSNKVRSLLIRNPWSGLWTVV